MGKRKTDEQFKAEVQKAVGDEYTVLGTYEKSNIKIQFKHITCGNIFSMTSNNFLQGHRCPKCAKLLLAKKFQKTPEQFKAEVKSEPAGDEYEVLGTYEGDKTKIQFKHITCGNTFFMTPHDFLHGRRCPKCAGCMKKTPEQFEAEVKNKPAGDEYEVLGTYEKSNIKIQFKHITCGNIFSMKPSSFLHGRRCPKCFGKFQKTPEQFEAEVKS